MLQSKLDKLMQLHRRHVFDNDDNSADRHYRALLRLKQTKTFRSQCEKNRMESDYRKSQRLLSMYA